MEEDVRWLQRLDSFRKACRRVLEITESDKEPDDLSELEQEGLVQDQCKNLRDFHFMHIT